MNLRRSMSWLDRFGSFLLAPVLVFIMASTAKEAAQASNRFINTDPASIYAAAWQQISNLYVDPTFNGQDWSVWEHKYDGQLSSTADALAAVDTMLASLNDRYTRVAHSAATAVKVESSPKNDVVSETLVASGNQVSASAGVVCRSLDGDIGYIKITSFSAPNCVQDFRCGLRALAGEKGLILDLRGNRGGLVANSLEIADMLLDSGQIMTSVSRTEKHPYTASGCPLARQKMAVLIDSKSASAAEILVGALKDNHRATLIGSKTFGKGLIQEITSLPGGTVMYVTVARYYTPSGCDINSTGITPDINVVDETEQIPAAMRLLQKKQPV